MPFLQQLPRQSGRTLPETTVDLLQGHHVSIEFMKYGKDTFGITPPIDPDGLVNVIAGESQFHAWEGMVTLARLQRSFVALNAISGFFSC